MQIRRMTALLMIEILLALVVPAEAESMMIPGLGPNEAYNEMVAAVEAGDYALARLYLEDKDMVKKDYRQARLYSLYLDAMAAVEAEDFDTAANLFESLALQTPSFLDSKTMHSYCQGRIMQEAGRYEEAAACYKSAIAYGDAAQRMQDCMSEAEQAQKAEAQSLYQRGLAQSSITLLQQALDSYVTIGDADMAATCQAEIDRINRKTAYDAAQVQYQQSLSSGDVSGLRTAVAAFAALGDFEDSAAQVKAIEQQILLLEREMKLTGAVADVSTVALSWTDSVPDGGTYVISYGASGNREVQRVTTTERQYTLTNLTPDTEYTVTITPEGSAEHKVQTTVKTARASAFGGAKLETRSCYTIGVSQMYLRSKSFAQWLIDDPDKVSYQDDNVLPLEDMEAALHRTGYAYYMNCTLLEKVEGPVTVRWILRTKDVGVYTPKTSEMTVLRTEYTGYDLYTYQGTGGELAGLAQYCEFICPLGEMLDALYQEQGAWPEGLCTMELYLNGALAGRGTFTIAHGQAD